MYCRQRECKPKFVCVSGGDGDGGGELENSRVPKLRCMGKKKTHCLIHIGAGRWQEVELHSYMLCGIWGIVLNAIDHLVAITNSKIIID